MSNLIIKDVRADWVFLGDVNQHGGYSMCVLIPDSHPQLAKVKELIEGAKAQGIAAGKFTEANTKSANFKKGLHNGTEDAASEERPAMYKGHFYLNANNKSQPGLVGADLQPLMDSSCLYSGAFYNVDVGVYPYNNKSKGIGVGLNNVMFVRDGERLDGRQSAEEAFSGLAAETGDLQ